MKGGGQASAGWSRERTGAARRSTAGRGKTGTTRETGEPMGLDERILSCRERAKALLNATDAQIEHGVELHRQSFVCDLFAFTPGIHGRAGVDRCNRVIEEGAGGEEAVEAHEDSKTIGAVIDAEARAACAAGLDVAGVDCLVSTVGVGPEMRRGLRNLARHACLSDHLEGVLRKQVTAAGVRRAWARGERSIVWSANSTPALGPYDNGYDMLRWLETYALFGVRMMHLTYNRRNWLGDGCSEETDAGLSAFGREVVARLNDLGVIVDTPHSGRQTTLDACRVSRAPVLSSHALCEGLHKNSRSKSDEEIKAIAGTGGVLGIVLLPSLLAGDGVATINTALDHLDYAIRLVGPDHVMIGSDHTFNLPPPAGVEFKPMPRERKKWWAMWRPGDLGGDPNEEASKGSLAWTNWPLFTAGLVVRGHSDEAIRKVIGANFLRVFEAAQSAAAPEWRAAEA